MKAVVAAFNQEKALVGAFSVIVQPVVEPMDRFAALISTIAPMSPPPYLFPVQPRQLLRDQLRELRPLRPLHLHRAHLPLIQARACPCLC